jgi:hypothetical protein
MLIGGGQLGWWCGERFLMRKAAVTVVVVVWRPTTAIIIISGVVKMNGYTYQQKINNNKRTLKKTGFCPRTEDVPT